MSVPSGVTDAMGKDEPVPRVDVPDVRGGYDTYISSGLYDRRYPRPNRRTLRKSLRCLREGGRFLDFGAGHRTLHLAADGTDPGERRGVRCLPGGVPGDGGAPARLHRRRTARHPQRRLGGIGRNARAGVRSGAFDLRSSGARRRTGSSACACSARFARC